MALISSAFFSWVACLSEFRELLFASLSIDVTRTIASDRALVFAFVAMNPSLGGCLAQYFSTPGSVVFRPPAPCYR
jgi:hypothetical protein